MARPIQKPKRRRRKFTIKLKMEATRRQRAIEQRKKTKRTDHD
jgi:hypothetical protein